MDVTTFLSAVVDEVSAAQAKHPPINSAHEGLAVLWEEFEEFKAEVWKRVSDRDPAAMTAELIQIAAMCVRIAEDLDLPSPPDAPDLIQYHQLGVVGHVFGSEEKYCFHIAADLLANHLAELRKKGLPEPVLEVDGYTYGDVEIATRLLRGLS